MDSLVEKSLRLVAFSIQELGIGNWDQNLVSDIFINPLKANYELCCIRLFPNSPFQIPHY